MERLYEVLEEINPGVNYQEETRLIDDGILDSMGILSLVSEMEFTFDVEITPAELIPANFNSASAMWEMITRLKSE